MEKDNFTQILIKISEPNPKTFAKKEKEVLIGNLIRFYKKYERHKYSDIAGYIYNNAESMEYLVENLQELHEFCEEDKNHTKTRIFKIIDHIQLERVRIDYLQEINARQTLRNMANTNNAVSNKTNIMSAELKNVKATAIALEKEVKDVGDHLKTFNMESITVLGIFSGIVMAFFGGMGFFSGVLNNIHLASKYRMFFATLLIGFSLFNIFFFLIYSIAKIVDRPIRSTCVDMDCNVCGEKCNSVDKLRKVYPILFYIDLTFILMMAILVIMWSLKV